MTAKQISYADRDYSDSYDDEEYQRERTAPNVLRKIEKFDLRLFGESGYQFYMFPYSFFRMMPMQDAVVLGYLINLNRTVATMGRHVNGEYFFCKSKKVEAELGVGRHRLKRILDRLEELNFIKVEREHHPQKKHDTRFVRVFLNRILQAVDDWYAENQRHSKFASRREYTQRNGHKTRKH